MDQRLVDNIKSNIWFSIWNRLTGKSNLSFFRKYMFALLVITMLGLLNSILFPEFPILVWVNISLAVPFIILAFLGGLVHFMVGRKITKLSKEFNIPFLTLRKQIHEVLNND